MISDEEWKSAVIKSSILSMMLNGTIPWNDGCSLRAMSDEDLIKEFGEAFDKETIQ